MTSTRSRRRVLVLALLAFVVATAAYAFTAGNTVPASKAGDGSGAITGYNVTNVAYNLDAANPQLIDSVEFDPDGRVTHIDVKASQPRSHWIWGAFKVTGAVLAELHALWLEPSRGDEYLGTLVNAYIERGGAATGWPIGSTYVDVGTLEGYREALRLLDGIGSASAPADPSAERRASSGADR